MATAGASAGAARDVRAKLSYYSATAPGLNDRDFQPGAPWDGRGITVNGLKTGETPEEFKVRARATYKSQEVTIIDARGHNGGIEGWSLANNGFAFIPAPEPVGDWTDRKSVAEEYLPRVREAALRYVPGARRAFVMGHQRRSEVPSRIVSQNYGYGAHTDYGPEYEEHFRRWIAARHQVPEEEAQSCGLMVLGFWVPVENVAYKSPLALLDKSSVNLETQTLRYIQAGDLGYAQKRPSAERVPAASQDAPALAPVYSLSHRWVYCSDMTTEQAIIFSQYDWRDHSCAMHSAFKDPFHDSWAECPPRRSVDIRILVTFGGDGGGGSTTEGRSKL